MASNEDGGSEARADPDAQTTVNDFLDFTEYLPSDMMRSLTLIGSLDDYHADSSLKLHELTKTWGELPNRPPSERPEPAKLRADISAQMSQALSSRIYAHAEAVRMSETVNRHYNKAVFLQVKLQAMMDNWPEEQQALSPVTSKSPQLSRSKLKGQAGADVGQRARQKRAPLVTVPGEVLAPYDIEYETVTEGSDGSSDDEGTAVTVRRTPAPGPKIKVINTTKPIPKVGARATHTTHASGPSAEEISANQAALLKPPPPDAEIGGPHAPWLQLTQHELARLRKRMKKNATWVPSETMILRELRDLQRGPEHYQEAKKKVEEEGKSFNATLPMASVEDGSGSMHLPVGAISVESVVADELPTSNKGMKLNEAKKLKREALAKMAAEDAEESAKKMAATAKLFLEGNGNASPGATENAKDAIIKVPKPRTNSRSQAKRKRDVEVEVGSEPPEESETPSMRPAVKRTKTETPVPPPQYGKTSHSTPTVEATNLQTQPVQTTTHRSSIPPVETPVPLPIPYQSSANTGLAKSPTPIANGSNLNAVTTTVPVRPPAIETPVPLPRSSDRRESVTPVAHPPLPSSEASRRETRADAAKRSQQQHPVQNDVKIEPQAFNLHVPEELPPRRASSRGTTPGKSTPAPETQTNGRPGSRGKAMSQEPQSSLAMDRPRRASTARNTPAPEPRPPSRRSKRPAPGVIKTTKSGGNSAVGKRKTAPKKKARTLRRDKDQPAEVEMEDVDDEGNPIDPNEPRYCICKNYSYGTMIQCDNVDGCKMEWFHLECVGLDDIPARTSKWYCPDCRKTLNVGEKGEVNSRESRR